MSDDPSRGTREPWASPSTARVCWRPKRSTSSTSRRRSLLNQLTTARFWSPAGHEVVYAGDRVEAVVIDRRAFDQDLLELRDSRRGLSSIVVRA